MRVKFLRKYGNFQIDSEENIEITEKEKEYLISTGTILVLDDETIENIPVVNVQEEKTTKNGRKKSVE